MNRWFHGIAAGVLLLLVAAKFSPTTGLTSLIRFGQSWETRRLAQLQDLPLATVPHSNGYDGQFYAQLALDPLLRNPATAAALDAPEYRARRILAPAVAAIAGAGRAWWILQSYALVNVLCWLVLAWQLAKAIPGRDAVSLARWAGCLFSMGVLESVRQSLVDLPALMLLSFAISAQDRNHRSASTLWLALANLAKESSLLGAVMVCWPRRARPEAMGAAITRLLLAAIPVLAWAWYVHHRLPSTTTSSGLGNFTWPLLGLASHFKICLTALMAGDWDGRYSMGLVAAIGLLLQGLCLWRSRDIESPWWRVGAAYALLLFILSPWVWSGYWAVTRVVLPMTIAFNLRLPDNRHFWLLWTMGNISLLHGLWRFL